VNIPVIESALKFGTSIVDVIDQYVEDKDLATKLKFAIAEKQIDFSMQIQASEHVPTFVKLMYAVRDVLIPMFRPLGTFALTAFAAYAATNDITLDPVLQAALAAAFPGWVASRHVEKSTKTKAEAEVKKIDAMRAKEDKGFDWSRIEVE
jgi:hypothetical protein